MVLQEIETAVARLLGPKIQANPLMNLWWSLF